MPVPRCSANWPKRLRSIFAPGFDASMDRVTVSAAAEREAESEATRVEPS
jgi:hypothetical protein